MFIQQAAERESQRDMLEENIFGNNGAVHGYSLIRMVERNNFGNNLIDDKVSNHSNIPIHKIENRQRMSMNIYFKKMQFSFNFKLNYKNV
mmetsp:Transcript_11947/g.20186  ORF Transcript_11947/g.20186 Transcript_11947/m.20186 type:complete len:90 (-) Transcript_11947:17-286(-)